MARAVLPNPSVRAEWLFAGIIDRSLDGVPGDHDLDDFETDTAIRDDDDDIVCQRAARMNLCSPRYLQVLSAGDGSPTQ